MIRTHSLSVLALTAKGGGLMDTSVASNLLCQMANFRHCVCDDTVFSDSFLFAIQIWQIKPRLRMQAKM